MSVKFFFLVSLLFVCFSAQASPIASAGIRDVVVAVHDVFIPDGIAADSESYVVVSGIFPNGCYRWKGSSIKHNTKFEHEIKSIASVSQGMCIMVLVPFSKEIRLGKLDSGTHILRFMSSDGTYLEKTLKIK